MLPKVDIYINVPFDRKEVAKKMSSWWDPVARSWYIPVGMSPENKARLLSLFSPKTTKSPTQAARNEVSDQTRAFRAAKGFLGRDDMHVAHVGTTFYNLFVQWCESEGISQSEIGVVNVCGEELFASRELSVKWRKYHFDNAKLEMQTVEKNMNDAVGGDPDDTWWKRYTALVFKLILGMPSML